MLVQRVDQDQPELYEAKDINFCVKSDQGRFFGQSERRFRDVGHIGHALVCLREVVCVSFVVKDNIANLTSRFISKDADLFRLVSLVVLEGLVGDLLGLDSDCLSVQHFVGVIFWLEVHLYACHNVIKAFILVRYDGLYTHTGLIFSH